MKTMLAKLFPSVFGGLDGNNSSSMKEAPGQQPGSNEFVKQPGDERIMGDVKEVDGHLVTTSKIDGGQAHPVWVRADAAEKRRQRLGRWFFGHYG